MHGNQFATGKNEETPHGNGFAAFGKGLAVLGKGLAALQTVSQRLQTQLAYKTGHFTTQILTII
ncbi:MAG: hypothetical protein WCK78_07560 [Paludibacter sp.]